MDALGIMLTTHAAQEEVRSHQPAPPQEEAQINGSLPSAYGEFGVGGTNATNACDGHEGMVTFSTLAPRCLLFGFS